MYRSIAVPVLLLAACGAPVETASTLSPADTAAIRRTYREMTAAGLTDDVFHMGRFFTEDAVWMPANQPAVEGRAAIEAWFTVRALQWDVEILQLEGGGDLAFLRTASTLNLDLPGFEPENDKSLEIWRRQPDGSWRIALSSFSSDTPPR